MKLKKIWDYLATPSKKWALGSLLLLGFAAGTVVVIGSMKTLEWTNSDPFCTSCHTMKYNQKEFIGSVHDINKTGQQVECAQCHVPETGVKLIIRKLEASNDVYQHFIGKSIDTPEKFEARRGVLAMREWTRMKKSDSAGCRGCHTEAAMDLSLQSPGARIGHILAFETSQTCIDCHKGIAHELPENWLGLETELNEKFSRSAQ